MRPVCDCETKRRQWAADSDPARLARIRARCEHPVQVLINKWMRKFYEARPCGYGELSFDLMRYQKTISIMRYLYARLKTLNLITDDELKSEWKTLMWPLK